MYTVEMIHWIHDSSVMVRTGLTVATIWGTWHKHSPLRSLPAFLFLLSSPQESTGRETFLSYETHTWLNPPSRYDGLK